MVYKDKLFSTAGDAYKKIMHRLVLFNFFLSLKGTGYTW